MEPMRPGYQFDSVLEDEDLIRELRERAATDRLRSMRRLGLEGDAVESVLAARGGAARRSLAPGAEGPQPMPEEFSSREAIVLEFGRPSLLIRNGTFELPESPTWQRTLALHRSNIEHAIARVGRVELLNHLTFDWVGTAWIVAPGVAMTNRHVAETFAERGADGLAFATNLLGQQITARVDFREEHDIPAAHEVRVRRVLWMAEPGVQSPDIALLELEADVPLPEPLRLAKSTIENRQTVGVIGYPAFDTRNGEDAMRRYFGDIFDVKRFAPGKVSLPAEGEHFFVHDCTTLGGNSGSAIIDLESGEVVGLHFSGVFRRGNFAVKVPFLEQALAQISASVPVPDTPPRSVLHDGVNPPESFEGRDGYVETFLGKDEHRVPLPGLGPWAEDAAPVVGTPEGETPTARYRHFSVVLSQGRRLPVVTAVNINGEEARRVRRRERGWFLDGRIAEQHQAGNEIYRHNDLDRGHMVRRLDPVWGDKETCAEANEDTFHYINACPQHKDLNQKEWLCLEDYILDNADAKELKVSVFTGPVLKDDDRPYRGVRLPREYWKVAVLVDADTERLSATGYLLTQEQMLTDVTEAAFLFGEFKTYQVPISEIETKTGLAFGLSEFDPLREEAGLETVGPRRIAIDTGLEIVFQAASRDRPVP